MTNSSDDRSPEHVVFFTAPSGDPAAERYPTLRAAVSRVEALANDEGVKDARVFQLVPVPLSVRSYFRVELEDPAPVRTGHAVPAAPPAAPPTASTPAAAPPAPQRPPLAVQQFDPAPEVPSAPHVAARDAADASTDDEADAEISTEASTQAEAADETRGADADAAPLLSGDEVRALREDRPRPLREMRDEVVPAAPQPRHEDEEPPAGRGRGLGFFVH